MSVSWDAIWDLANRGGTVQDLKDLEKEVNSDE